MDEILLNLHMAVVNDMEVALNRKLTDEESLRSYCIVADNCDCAETHWSSVGADFVMKEMELAEAA